MIPYTNLSEAESCHIYSNIISEVNVHKHPKEKKKVERVSQKMSVKKATEEHIMLYIQLWIHFAAYSGQKHTPNSLKRVTIKLQ